MGKHEWILAQTRAFEGLRGRKVLRWCGVEMALGENGEGKAHTWQHASIPMLQLTTLHAILTEGTLVVNTAQDDDLWGLSCAIRKRKNFQNSKNHPFFALVIYRNYLRGR